MILSSRIAHMLLFTFIPRRVMLRTYENGDMMMLLKGNNLLMTQF